MQRPKKITQPITSWFKKNARPLPWRRTQDPYAIWISEIMLQQTTVKTVIPYWERWMRELPTIKSLANASEERVLKLWEGLGYYSRARNLQRAAQQIVSDHAGIFPTNFTQILDLPGIGRYTAGAIASIAFGQATPIVDGNVIRFLARFYGIHGDPKSKEINAQFWTLAAKLVSSTRACSHFNQGMMELGATICTPRHPNCPACPLRKNCLALAQNLTGKLPEIAPRPTATTRIFRAHLARQNGRIFLRKRPKNVINSGFWEMPNVEVPEPAKSEVICRIKHSITRYRMTLEVLESKTVPSEGEWVALTHLTTLPVVSSHRKALQRLGLLPPSKTQTVKNLMEVPQRCASVRYQM